jgi:hypothetical protein
MPEHPDKDLIFVTVSMAEILLAQNLVEETRAVVVQLLKSDPQNPRVKALAERLRQVMKATDDTPTAIPPQGRDYITLEWDGALRLRWELTRDGLDIAKAEVRYLGNPNVRLFTAQPGPRGVRTASLDIEAEPPAGEHSRPGLPVPAVHVAAAGFLARTGRFLPLARSEPLLVTR